MAELYQTALGQKIVKYDYREGYTKWCATCAAQGEEVDNTLEADHEHYRGHAFNAFPAAPIPCLGCGGFADGDLYYGVGINRVAHAVYCSRECAWKHDPSKWEGAR